MLTDARLKGVMSRIVYLCCAERVKSSSAGLCWTERIIYPEMLNYAELIKSRFAVFMLD